MHPDHLLELIRRHSLRSRESLQVADRLKALLPQVLLETKRSLRCRGAEADRHALTDPAYLGKVDEYLELLRNGLEARIQFETHRMLLQAWQSLNAYHKVRRTAPSAQVRPPQNR